MVTKLKQLVRTSFGPDVVSQKARRTHDKGSQGQAGEVDALNFRFGFLFHHKGNPAKSKKLISGWLHQDLGEYELWTHPQAAMREARAGNSFVLVVGYCYALGDDSVEGVLAKIAENGISPRIDWLGGRYALIRIEGGEFEIAHDAFGSKSIFYVGNKPIVSSHSALIAFCYRVKRCDLMAEFMTLPEYINRSVRYLPGDRTVYRGIYALVPNNLYNGKQAVRYWPRQNKADFTKEEFIAAVQGYLERLRSCVGHDFRPLFGITGGVDSRAIFCAFPDGFDGVTWTTRYLKEIERPIVERTIAALSINHKYLDHRSVEPGAVADAAEMSGGRFRPPSRLTEVMAFAYPREGNFIFIRGYGGEILRGFKSYFNMKDLSVKSMVKAYGSSQRKTKDGERYLSICNSAFKEYHRRGNYGSVGEFGYQPMDVFYWEHRMGMWGASMLNEMDPAMPGLVGLNSRPLFEVAFGVEDEQRLSKQILQDVVASQNARLADMPYL